jgi:hypothetical protein
MHGLDVCVSYTPLNDNLQCQLHVFECVCLGKY